MRFGMFIPQGWRHDLVGIDPARQWAVMRDLAVAADRGPWDSVWVYDHFHTVPVPSEEATHEAWTLMAAYAAVTENVKLGQMCTCMSYRNPAYLAKIAATVDIVSGGRAQMGIGGGWYEHEWRAYGYGFPPVRDRLARLREGVEIMREAWSEGVVSYQGEHYQVEGAIVRPLPLQPEGIPLWIAGGGEKVTLRIAAEHAQYTNFGGGDLDEFRAKSAILRGHCEAIGRDFGAITRSENMNVVIGSSEAEVTERVAAVEARVAPYLGDRTADFMAEYRNGRGLVGTPEQIVEKLSAHQAAGMDYLITYWPEAAYDRSGVELFEREVIPALS
jgi:F420-dependent oxidoreductase-like protein